MSYATFALTIVFFINLFLFLLGSPQVNAPMLGLLQAVVTNPSGVNWGQFFAGDWSTLLAKFFEIGAIAMTVYLVSVQLSGPQTALTGNTFAAIHALTVIAISIFVTFFAIPNFGAMGFPSPLDLVVQVFFGFLTVLAIFGLLRGE